MFADETQRTNVKICGLTNLEDARFASGALADYLGFIFYEDSKRYIEPGQAGAIINWIEGPRCVGVFVNQPMDDVNNIARQTGIDLIQLHGNESPEYADLLEKPVIKAIHVDEGDTLSDLREKMHPYEGKVEHFLFDTKDVAQWGGTGRSFDWSILEDLSEDYEFFLSGGINPENVEEACKKVQPFAIDLATGVEISDQPGQKDYDKVEALFDQMRSIWKRQEMGEL
jgi:phosphoribosylanthranilate isomerase